MMSQTDLPEAKPPRGQQWRNLWLRVQLWLVTITFKKEYLDQFPGLRLPEPLETSPEKQRALRLVMRQVVFGVPLYSLTVLITIVTGVLILVTVALPILVTMEQIGDTRLEQQFEADPAEITAVVDLGALDGSGYVSVQISQIRFPQQEANHVCVEKITFTVRPMAVAWPLGVSSYEPYEIQNGRTFTLTRGPGELCSSYANSQGTVRINEVSGANLEAHMTGGTLFALPVRASSTFFFPFDARSLDVAVSFAVQPFDDVEKQIAPNIAGGIKAPGWKASVTAARAKDPALGGDVTLVHVEYRRPLLYQVLFWVVLGSLFLFTVALFGIRDQGNLLEVGAGILLGLWATQEYLVPAELVTGPTIVRTAVVFIYCVFALAVLRRLVLAGVSSRLNALADRLYSVDTNAAPASAPAGGDQAPPLNARTDAPVAAPATETATPSPQPQGPGPIWLLLALLAVAVGLFVKGKRTNR